MKRIISFDGGGICGLLSLVVLERLLSEYPDLLDDVDLYAGTSTGGIISLGLADGLDVVTLRKMYETQGHRIFKRDWWSPLGITGAKYTNKGLKALMAEIFGARKLGGLKGKVLVPVFALYGHEGGKPMWRPKFFTNWQDEDPDCAFSVLDVAMATSAAPTYFPSYNGYVDGGVVANNPAAAAMSMMLNPKVVGRRLNRRELRVLSIGTGTTAESIQKNNVNWGIMQWGSHIIDIFMQGVADVPTYACQALLQDNFHRVNSVYDKGKLPAMDEYKRVDELIALGEAMDLGPTEKWIEEHWFKTTGVRRSE
jgi:patatin-like phospholipase/acyl hydrolase